MTAIQVNLPRWNVMSARVLRCGERKTKQLRLLVGVLVVGETAGNPDSTRGNQYRKIGLDPHTIRSVELVRHHEPLLEQASISNCFKSTVYSTFSALHAAPHESAGFLSNSQVSFLQRSEYAHGG